MKQEIEVKFLNIDHDYMRERLKDQGATCEQQMRLMRRAIMDYPDNRLQNERDGFVRVRDEGNKITLTYKQIKELTIDGVQEVELVIDSFEQATEFLRQLGLNVNSLQESKRETWKLDGVEVVLDEWPWVKPYIEVEGESEDAIRAVSQKLGLNYAEAKSGDVMVVYRSEYPHLKMSDTVGNLSAVRFDTPLPEMLNPPSS